MNTHVCEEHGDDVVVFHGTRGTVCPLCQALMDCRDADQKVEDLTTERNSLKEEIESVTAEVNCLEEELGSRER
jgi:predicted RNase H-like nuclease (RuvC/YqgF family)